MAIDVQSPPESRGAAPINGVPVNEVQKPPEATVTSLVGGIIADAQLLVQQQIAMIRQEIRDDFRKTKEAALVLGAGAGIALLGCGLLVVMLPLVLYWAVPQLPLWAACGIVGVVLTALGGAVIFAALKKFDSFNPLPEQSADALMENLKWKTNPK